MVLTPVVLTTLFACCCAVHVATAAPATLPQNVNIILALFTLYISLLLVFRLTQSYTCVYFLTS